MRTVLQIFGTLSIIARIGDTCLSNPSLRCSVASGSSSSPSYNPSCVPQTGASGSVYQSGQYNGFLGDHVQAKAYSGKGGTADFAKEDLDLRCHDDASCKWRNDPKDELDWVLGSGNIDPAKMPTILWATVLPDVEEQKPGEYEVPEETLENCLTVQLTDNHTIIASIPPIFEPFEIVLRGYDFSNTPEGGLLILDGIDYFAHLDTPENCVGQQLDSDTELEPFTEAENATQVDPSLLENQGLSFTNGVKITNAVTPASPFDDVVSTDTSLVELCSMLNCGFDQPPPCRYKPIGTDAEGDGVGKGWKPLTAPLNIANRLTGIHLPPGTKESVENGTGSDNLFLVAEFPGFNRTRLQHKFVLEAPEFQIDTTVFFGFQKYLSTQGVELTLCEDTAMKECFWDNFLHSAEPFARSWTDEVVRLPSNLKKFFVLATQDPSIPANNGQVGLAAFRLYSDADGQKPLC
ncbi:unnamed protein product, partial [Mesorhabditis spiculigera]